MNNFLFFNEKTTIDSPIYRVISIERFLQFISENEIVLVKPKLWDDPFENIILNQELKISKTATFSYGARKHIYGQCWSNYQETDAMWRIYSPNNTGVKIKTTPRKIYDSVLSNNATANIDEQFFIGKVSYKSKDNMRELLSLLTGSNYDSGYPSNYKFAESLLYKRKAFEHENEVRIIFYDRSAMNNSDILKMKINTKDIIEEVVFDPRIDDLLFDVYKNFFTTQGYNFNISKSDLYSIPDIT